MDYISIKKLSTRHSVDFYQLKSYIEYLGIQIQDVEKVQSVSTEDSELVDRFLQTYSINEISYIISHQIQPFFEGTLLLNLRKRYNLNEKQFITKCANADLEFKYVYSEAECRKFNDFMSNTSNLNRAELRDLKYTKEGWLPLRDVLEELGKKYGFCENTGTKILEYLSIEVYKPSARLAFLNKEQKDEIEGFLKKFNSSRERMLFFQEQTCMKKYGVSNPSLIEEARNKISEKVKASCTDERQKKIEETKLKKYGKRSTTDSEKSMKSRLNNQGSFVTRCIYRYDNMEFSSSWEIYYYIYQKEILHNDIQNGKIFEYFCNGTRHLYQCDFLVNGENIEIKGNQYLDENGNLYFPYINQTKVDSKEKQIIWNAKQECMRQNNVKVISRNEIQPIIRAVDEKFTSDYVPLFKKDIPFPYPDIGNKSDFDLIRYFHKSIYEATRLNKLSPLKAWENKELVKKSALNRLQYIGSCRPSDIIQGFNVAKIAPKISVFKPNLAERLIKQYLPNANVIVDPFSGFSGRMLGSFNAGVQMYYGYDINKDHVKESNRIIDYKVIWDRCSVEIQDLITFEGKDWKSLGNKDSICLFTCPPYGGKEHWSKDKDEIEKTCDEWIDLCLQKHRGCDKYLFVVDTTEKYRDFIVETIENKSHFGKNTEMVILLNEANLII